MEITQSPAPPPYDGPSHPGTTPTISIVTVCLNSASTIRRTIDSVLGQTRQPYEYIIVDGGSTDSTLEIVRAYGSRVTRWVSEKDRGISDAFNKGIGLATGDLIGLLNADDWYTPTTLERVAASAGTADLIHGKVQLWRGTEKDYLAEGSHTDLSREMTLHHPTVFIRRAAYHLRGGYKLDYRLAMDYELALRFLINGGQFVYLPEVLANMSFDGASDLNWHRAIREVCRAKVENGIPRLQAYLYYAKQMIRSSCARLLRKLGLGFVVKSYRTRFSLVRKSY